MAASSGAATRGGDSGGMAPTMKDPWLAWAAFVVPALATSFTWRLTVGLPFVNRVAIAVAAALVVYGVVYVIAKGLPRR